MNREQVARLLVLYILSPENTNEQKVAMALALLNDQYSNGYNEGWLDTRKNPSPTTL